MKGKEGKKQSKNPSIQSKQPRGVSMDMETSWAAQELKSTYSDLNNMARFQQKQLQEKEQKLLQLYDQQQQRAYQVVQRGSAGSTGSNHATSISQHTTQVTKTSSSSHTTTSTSQGGKVRQMFDERRQTGVKGIDRSYPLEPLENKPRKQANGNAAQKNGNLTVSRQSVTVKRVARADVNSNLNGGKPLVSYHEEITRESFGHLVDDDEFGNENHVVDYANGSHRDETCIEEVLDEDTIERNRMMAKLHLMEYDETLKHRVVKNDLESEEFPEEFMVDVPDKLPKQQNVTKKISQAEVRLERFKNANAKRNNITRNATTKKRSDPVLPAKSTSSVENVAETEFVSKNSRRLSPEVKQSMEEFSKDRKSPKFFCKESEKSATTYAIDTQTRSKSPEFSKPKVKKRSESPKFFCKESEKSATTYAIDSGMDAKVVKNIRKRSESPKFFCKESEKSATTYVIDSNTTKRLSSDVLHSIKKRSESPKFFCKESEKSATTYDIDNLTRSKSPEFSKPKVKKRSESPKFFCKESEKSTTTYLIDPKMNYLRIHNESKRIDSPKFSKFDLEKNPNAVYDSIDLKNRDYMKDTESFLLKTEPSYKKDKSKLAPESMGIDTVDRVVKQKSGSKKIGAISRFSSVEDLKSTKNNKSLKLEKVSKANSNLSEFKSTNILTRLRRERSSSPQLFHLNDKTNIKTNIDSKDRNLISKSPNFDTSKAVNASSKRGKSPSISHRSSSKSPPRSTSKSPLRSKSKSPDFTAKSFRKCSSSPQFYVSDSERSASVLMVTPETICKPKAESRSCKTKDKVAKALPCLESSREFIRNSVSRFFSERCEAALREADVRNEVQSGENEARLRLSRSSNDDDDARLQFYPEGIDDGKVDGSIDGRGKGDRDWPLKLQRSRDERRNASKFHHCETEKYGNSMGEASKSGHDDNLEIESCVGGKLGPHNSINSRKSPEFQYYEREKGDANINSRQKASKTNLKTRIDDLEIESCVGGKLGPHNFTKLRKSAEFHYYEREKGDTNVNSRHKASKTNLKTRNDDLEIETCVGGKLGAHNSINSRKSPEFQYYERKKSDTNVNSSQKASKTNVKGRHDDLEMETCIEQQLKRNSSIKSRKSPEFHYYEREKGDTNVNSGQKASKINVKNSHDDLEIETCVGEKLGTHNSTKSRKSPEFQYYEREKSDTNINSRQKASKINVKNKYETSEAEASMEEKLKDESFTKSSPISESIELKKHLIKHSKNDTSREKSRSPKLNRSSLKPQKISQSNATSPKPNQSPTLNIHKSEPPKSVKNRSSSPRSGKIKCSVALRSTKLIRDAMKRENNKNEVTYVCPRRSKGSRSSSSSSADAGRISIEEDEVPARCGSCTSPETRETKDRYIKQEEKGGFSRSDRKSSVEGLFTYSAHKGSKKRGSPFDSSVFQPSDGEKRVSLQRNTSDSRSCGGKSVISGSRREIQEDETDMQMREGNLGELKAKKADLKSRSIDNKLDKKKRDSFGELSYESIVEDLKKEIRQDTTPMQVQNETWKPKEDWKRKKTDPKSRLIKERRNNLNGSGSELIITISGSQIKDATTMRTQKETSPELKRKKADLKSRLIKDNLGREKYERSKLGNTWNDNRSSTSESIIRDSIEEERKIVNDSSKEEKLAGNGRNLKVESFDSELSKENYETSKRKTRSSSVIKESTWGTSENATEDNRKNKSKSSERRKQTPSPSHSNPRERSVANNSDRKSSDLQRKMQRMENGASTSKATQKGTFRIRKTLSPQNSLKQTQTLKSMELVRRLMQDSNMQTEERKNESSKLEPFFINFTNSNEINKQEYRVGVREKRMQIEEVESKSEVSKQVEINSELASTKNYERTDSVESALRRFDSIEAESVCNPLSQRSLEQGEECSETANETKSSLVSLRTGAKVNPTNVNVIESSKEGRTSPLRRNSPRVGSKSPSCKRKLFNEDSSRKSETSSWKSTSDKKKLGFSSKRSTSGDEMETIDKRRRKKETSTGSSSFCCVKQLRSIEDIRKSMAAGESCEKNGGSANKLAKASRINSDDREGNGERISLRFGDTKSMTTFTCRLAKSPSPEKATETSSRSRRIPASPSKSPDTVARRPSTESKAQDTKPSKRPTPMKGAEAIGNRKTTTSTRKSTDVVDGAILENGLHLRDQTAETKYDNDSPTTKKSDAFVIDFDEQPPKENDAPLPRKLLSRKQSTEKQISSTQSVRPPSSVSSTCSGSSMQGSRGKMASRAKTPISGSTTYKGSASKSGGNMVAAETLVACKLCGRRFAQDRVTLHEQICAKTGQKKRKTFDTMMYRVRGTDLEPFVKKGLTKKLPERSKKPEGKSNWRRKHEDFINAIRSAKQVQAHLAAGGKLSDLPPPPVSDNCDYIQCPHCGRKFNQAAAERHIPKCEHMLHNKPIHSRAPKPRR